MREYGSVSPQFWIGRTGKALRGKTEAQLLALYLMTSPHANMIGVFHCPIAYMAHETGLTFEGASKGLQCLIEVGFCTYDDDDEYVFVHNFALHQVGDSLAATDKRCKGVENELSKVPENKCWRGFRARYAVPYNLRVPGVDNSKQIIPFEAPSKPLRSQEQEQEQEQEQKQKTSARAENAQVQKTETENRLPETSAQTAPRPSPPKPSTTATPEGQACQAMRAAGLASVDPADPRLRELVKAGVQAEEFAAAATEAVAKGKKFAYALAVVAGRRADAVELAEAAARAGGPPPTRGSGAMLGDIARSTVPGPKGRDPALVAMEADDAKAAKPSLETLARMAALRAESKAKAVGKAVSA